MTESNNRTIPLLPLRGLLVFPTMVLHLDVGRDKSVQALEQAMVEDSEILLTSQVDLSVDEPGADDMYQVGTMAKVKQMLKLPNGTIRVLVEGLERAKIEKFTQKEEYFQVEMSILSNVEESNPSEELALMRNALEQFEEYIRLSKKVSKETLQSVQDIAEPGRFADIVSSHLPLKVAEKQELLETVSVKKRLQRILDILNNEKEVLGLEQKIGQTVKKSMEKTQKEYYLREQMKAIQKELGDKDGKDGEVGELREKIEQSDMPSRCWLKPIKSWTATKRCRPQRRKVPLSVPISNG